MRAGELVADRFALERVAGSGGMGTVYRARDRATGAAVALKVLVAADGLRAERFAREARILAQLSHPGIVRYVAHGTTVAGEAYLVMEWLEGEDLAQRLARETLTVEQSVALIGRVSDALGAAHARGVIHRDIKPSNLFLPDGDFARVKVLDFGVARVAGGVHGELSLTAGRVGTPRYMSPEQARGDREIDARADVFSLGCVLYACLTGRVAFLGEDEIGVLAKILLEDPPRVREVKPRVPHAIDDLVMRMLAKDPTARPEDGAALARELAALGTVATGEGSGPGQEPAALGEREQRLLCVILSPRPPGVDDTSAPTNRYGEPEVAEAAVRDVVQRHDGHLEPLHGGGFVITVTGGGAATDLAAQAARLALELRGIRPRAGLALATGRGFLAHRLPVGDAIDRAVELLRLNYGRPGPAEPGREDAPSAHRFRPASESGVRIDELTAGLLGARFEVMGGAAAGLHLLRERDLADAVPTLLGRPTPCVGRERELGVLEGLYRECVAEKVARAVLISGPAGVGKSRLRQELLRGMDESVERWIGRGDPLRAGSPFAMLAQPLRRAAGMLYGESPAILRQKLRARVSRHLPAADVERVSEFLGEMCGVPFPDETSVQLRAAHQDAMLMGDQIRRAWEDWLAAECEAHPVVIVLEDLQWGDAPSVSFVDAALRNLHDRPLLVLALARPEANDLFPDLWANRPVTKLHLGELGVRASERLVREVLGDDVPAERVQSIVQRAAGNAFYLEELIRSLAEGRDELPETVLAMVQARIERLPPEARRVLRAASVFGDVFWKGGVIALAGGARRAHGVEEWLGELTLREVITRRRESKFPGEVEYAFRHSLVREAAVVTLTDKDRQLAHRVAGEWLVQAGETDALVLAEHTERGGETYHAAGYYKRAAEQALDGNDFASALLRADRGVACGAAGEVLASLRRIQAEAHRWRGENAAADFRGGEALKALPPGSPLWYEVAGEVAIAAGRRGNLQRLDKVVDMLRARPPGSEHRHERVAALTQVANELLLLGRGELARELLALAEEILPRLTDASPNLMARVSSARGHLARFDGDMVTFVKQTEEAVASYLQAGNERGACAPRTNLGVAYLELGQFERAEVLLRENIATALRLRLAHITATAKHNLGMALARQGKIEEGRREEEEAVALLQAQGNRRFEGGARAYLAAILAMGGEAAEAEREARAAADVLRLAPPLRPFAVAILARTLLSQGRVAEAEEEIAEVVPLLDTPGLIEEGEAAVRLIYAEVLHAKGDLDGARAVIALAARRLGDRAEAVSDTALRASFLARVDENSRTLSLARDWNAL